MEEPSYFLAHKLFRDYGCTLQPVRQRMDGANPNPDPSPSPSPNPNLTLTPSPTLTLTPTPTLTRCASAWTVSAPSTWRREARPSN